MKDFGYKRTIFLKAKDDAIQEKERLVSLFISEFMEEKLAIGKDADKLTFERKMQITTNIRENIYQLYQPLKKGEATLSIAPNKRIKAVIFVSLKFYFLMSLYVCLVVGGVIFLRGAATLADVFWLCVAFVLASVTFFIQNKLKVDRILMNVKSSFRFR